MANENLIPMDKRTEDEQRRIASEGGKASGAARRRKRSLREAAEYYLSLGVADTRTYNRVAADNVDPEDIDNQMAMIAGLTRQAIKGDAKAAKVIIELLGKEADGSEELARAKELLGGVDSAID